VAAVSGGMFCLVYGFSNAAAHGWRTPWTWGVLVAGAVLLIVFAAWQTRAAHPLLPPRVILDRNRGGAYLTSFTNGAGIFGIFRHRSWSTSRRSTAIPRCSGGAPASSRPAPSSAARCCAAVR
jgi:hypothetical protein